MSGVSLFEKVHWVIRHEGVDALLAKAWRRVTHPRRPKPVPYRWEDYAPSAAELDELRQAAHVFDYRPVISVLLPVYNPEREFLEEAVESVVAQTYPFWELCIADDCSTRTFVRPMLEAYAARDSRIRVVFRESNGHIAESSNSALDLASGEFSALLDHDDTLAPHALHSIVDALNDDRGVDLLYSNEDKIDRAGVHSAPGFKGAWSPEYFLSFMYIGHLTVYRTSLIRSAGGFRKGFEGSQDYDLALRVTELTDRVRHIPHILYHWRMHGDSVAGNIHAKPYAFTAAKRALQEALQRRGNQGATVRDGDHPGVYRVGAPGGEYGDVTVLLYADDAASGSASLEAWKRKTQFGKVRFLLGYPGEQASQEQSPGSVVVVEAEYRGQSRATLKHRFWRSALPLVPEGAAIVLADARLLPERTDWLQELLFHQQRSGIGAVGAKLLTPAGDVVHAGYLVDGTRVAHCMYGAHRLDHGYGARVVALNNVSAVSGSCTSVRREVLEYVCSQPEEFHSEQALELALAMTARRDGLRIVFNPYAACRFLGESPPRVVELQREGDDLRILKERFAFSPAIDPYYPLGFERSRFQFELERRGA